MKKKTSKLITNLILLLCITVKAQTTTNDKIYSISATLFDEHIAAPFEIREDSPRHLGAAISYELSRKRSGVYQFAHIFQIGYYYHKNFNQAGFIAWKPKFELRFADTFNIHVILGVGYAHSFPTQQTYKFDNGKYKKKTNWGKPHFMPSVGFGAGLHLDKLGIPIEIFGRYETFSLAPYAIKGRIPMTINTMLGLGVKYTFN
ncbi:hypothetical protein [Aureibaculum conchae]|uniref:hypothetical protein n=1 Tax=Aureibaculum sp. 2308TA14-22 TaxID=3108392 RepID=UPI003390E6B7